MARSIGSGVRLPRRGCEVNYAPCPLSRGLVLLLRVWPYLLLVPVWPVFGVQLQADLGFLAFPRLCSDALIRRLASRRPPRRRPVFDPGGSRLASRRPPRRRPVFDPGGSHSESALAFRHVALFVRPWLSARARAAVASCGREWRWWELFGDSPLSPPRPVIPYRFSMASIMFELPASRLPSDSAGARLLCLCW
jgi:hypothetical protein